MKDLMGMMKKAQEFQQRAQELQAEAENHLVEGTAGAGLVSVTLSAKGDMRGLRIDPSLFTEDNVEILEDLILAAHADARSRGEAYMAEKMSEMTSGLPLPPGMKFPF